MKNEIFPNPTVKQVIFQINFPTLFYLENRMGDLQNAIMEKLPKSSLLNTQRLLITEFPSDKKPFIPENDKSKSTIWRFESQDDKIQLNILNNSLDINSEFYKTYNSEENNNFRDVIKYVLDIFLEITNIPIITRMGLRYVDECPVPSNDNETFLKFFNSTFPLENRFDLKHSEGMDFRTIIKKGDYKLIYQESFQKKDDSYKLILDFDGIAENINSGDYLEICDHLHEIVSDEFNNSITEEFKDSYMRNSDEVD
jgi:uncharacterized protein (TIGR04255 family)